MHRKRKDRMKVVFEQRMRNLCPNITFNVSARYSGENIQQAAKRQDYVRMKHSNKQK